MKANEFVKKFGWGAVKEIIKNAPDWAFETAGINDYAKWEWSKIYPMNAYCKIDDLKRLVESWELVEKHGGLIEAKYYLHAIAVSGSDFFDALYSAVDDVESCQ